ncbi:Rv2466c family mycothiol-dependent reductase [soil metagenome]
MPLMHVDFWFDPVCPFCWVTSRWLNRVAPHRDLDVTWRPISLLFKNEIDEDHPFYAKARRTTDLLRFVEAVRAAGHEDAIGRIYTEFGRQIHNRQEFDFDIRPILTGAGLDADLATALDDSSWDAAIKDGMAAGLALTGDDVGTPLIAVDGSAGRVGLFGPVITDLPELEASLELWDGFVKMAGTAGFFELKRTRTESPTPPDESVLDAQIAPG